MTSSKAIDKWIKEVNMASVKTINKWITDSERLSREIVRIDQKIDNKEELTMEDRSVLCDVITSLELGRKAMKHIVDNLEVDM